MGHSAFTAPYDVPVVLLSSACFIEEETHMHNWPEIL